MFEAKCIMGAAKKISLAGLGALALAREEAQHWTNKLVERGAVAEEESRKYIYDMIDKGRKHTKNTTENIVDSSMDGWERLLVRVGIPTKREFQELTQRVESLAQKIDTLVPPPIQEPTIPETPANTDNTANSGKVENSTTQGN